MELHQHRDGMVFLRDKPEEDAVYGAHAEMFASDFGRPLPALPPGMVAMRYNAEAKILTYYDAKGNAYPMEGQVTFPLGESVCAARCVLVAKQQARIPAAGNVAPLGPQDRPNVIA